MDSFEAGGSRPTDAESAEARRLESLRQLVTGLAHDFNNLLGVILNCSTLLERRLTDPNTLVDVQEIHAAAEEAVGLTRQLLGVASRDPADPEHVALNDLLRAVVPTIERPGSDRVELRLELADEPLVCFIDERQLAQIVTRLATNALEAMPAGGTLTIVTRGSADQATGAEPGSQPIVLEVIDTGSGMTAEVAARAVEPFFTTKRRTMGTGLGLAVVDGLVRQNNGTLTISSMPGAGTTVTVLLPSESAAQ